MPYKVFRNDGRYCVYKHDEAGNKVGSLLGCHDNHTKAVNQLRALYANETMEFLSSQGIETGIKTFENDNGRYAILWTSNAFKDREKETFKTKAWEDYVARRDARGGKYDKVWFWHMKGTDFADVVWEDVVDRVLVDVIRFHDNQMGDKMWHAINHPEEFAEIAPMGWGTSHGFAYPASTKQNGVYDFVEKFETTVLPYHRASNLWGGIKEVLNMNRVTPEKKNALAALVGQELADKTLTDAEKASSILEQAGIEFKEDDNEAVEETAEEEVSEELDETEEVDEEEGEETDEEGEETYELEVTDELVKEIANHVDVSSSVKEAVNSSITGLKEAIIAELTPVIAEAVKSAMSQMTDSKEAVIQQALSGKIKLTPWSASQASETEVAPKIVNAAKEARTPKKQRDVVHDVVQNMIGGKI